MPNAHPGIHLIHPEGGTACGIIGQESYEEAEKTTDLHVVTCEACLREHEAWENFEEEEEE